MTPDQWAKAEKLFEQARSLAGDARAEFLARECGDDADLRAEVESLLAHHEAAGSEFLRSFGPASPVDPGATMYSPSPHQQDVGNSPHPPEAGATQDSPSPHSPEAGATEDQSNRDPPEAGPTHEQQRHRQDAHATPDHPVLGIPTDLIDGYTLVREIHRGGQGIVYQAIQKGTKRKVAVKVLLEGPFAGKSARRRFEREIELVARLRHPNIVEVFHSGTTADGRQYCVMDYVRGTPLDKYVRDKKLAMEEALELFAKVCEAVNYAHQRGVIHRDLKPSNILVDSDGVPKVLDFGLAKQLSGPDETLVSLTGQVVGTLPYMSPEQARGNPDEIDIRTDVYSLGVVLYEVLTGAYPYPVVGQMAEVLKHIAETPPTPPSRTWKKDSGVGHGTARKLRAGACPIDDEVQTIVLRGLAKERDRRYQSAGELAKDVEHYLKNEPIEAKKDSAWYTAKKLLHQYYKTAITAILLLLVSVVSLGMFIHFRSKAQARVHLQRKLRTTETTYILSIYNDLIARGTMMQVMHYYLPDALLDKLGLHLSPDMKQYGLCKAFAEQIDPELRKTLYSPMDSSGAYILSKTTDIVSLWLQNNTSTLEWLIRNPSAACVDITYWYKDAFSFDTSSSSTDLNTIYVVDTITRVLIEYAAMLHVQQRTGDVVQVLEALRKISLYYESQPINTYQMMGASIRNSILSFYRAIVVDSTIRGLIPECYILYLNEEPPLINWSASLLMELVYMRYSTHYAVDLSWHNKPELVNAFVTDGEQNIVDDYSGIFDLDDIYMVHEASIQHYISLLCDDYNGQLAAINKLNMLYNKVAHDKRLASMIPGYSHLLAARLYHEVNRIATHCVARICQIKCETGNWPDSFVLVEHVNAYILKLTSNLKCAFEYKVKNNQPVFIIRYTDVSYQTQREGEFNREHEYLAPLLKQYSDYSK